MPPFYEGPWLATRRFFAPYGSPPEVDSGTGMIDLKNPEDILACSQDANCLPQLRRFFGLRERVPIDCVLATVPDPYHTRLALLTDQMIGAIRKGAGPHGWEISAQWLPWNDTVDPEEHDPEKRAQQRNDIREQEKQPGVLVFRHAAARPNRDAPVQAKPGTLLVFVVGETPTGGVNPEQFQIARAYMTALGEPQQNADTVKIDGPTFSGSLYSLAHLIEQDKIKQPHKQYLVRSGTTQSQHAIEAFRFATKSDFESATEDLARQDHHFRDLLGELHIRTDRAAVLSEDESAFGRAAAQPKDLGPIRVFRFPRDISHLRDAYRSVVGDTKSDKAPVPDLNFSLKDSNVGEDSIPTYSAKQTPLAQNGVVNEVTRTIRADDIRIIEVSATNVLDLLFLAGVLRRQCPDTRVVIQLADLLFVQAEQTQSLEGTLFLSSYPMFGESGIWREQSDRKEIAVFPNSLSEAAVTAAFLLLSGSGKPAAEALAEEQLIPPSGWLLTLDHRGFTPVRVWPSPAEAGRLQNKELAHVSSPRLLSMAAAAFALFSIAIGGWMIRLDRHQELTTGVRFAPPAGENSWRCFYLFLFLLILIGIQIAIYVPRPFLADWPRLVLMLAGCAVPGITAAKIGYHYCRAGTIYCRAMRWAALLVLSGVVLWSANCLFMGSRGQLFSFRAAELRFGSSPLWPILAAAVALAMWCLAHVARLHLAFCAQPQVVTGDAGLVWKGRLQKSYEDFNQSARSALGPKTPGQKQILVIGVGLAALCVLFRVWVPLGSIDGLPYDILNIPLQILLAVLLLLTCWHLRIFWRCFHDFTTSLDLLPFAHAFFPAAPASANRPIWVRHLDFQSLDVHVDAVRILHDMRLQPEQLMEHGLSVAEVSDWETSYWELVDKATNTNPPQERKTLAEAHAELWRSNHDIAATLRRLVLEPAWASQPWLGPRLGPGSGKLDDTSAKKDDHIHGDPAKVTDLAETFLALHYTPYLMYGVQQIRNLLWFPSIGFVLLLLALTSYNFQAPHLIGRILMVLFAAIAWVLGSSMAQLERDPILSRIAGTTPNELGAGFYLKLARYGALPVLGLLAWQFPSISNFLLSWIQPALEALQ